MNTQSWFSLVVRYWSANMTKIHNRGSNWPGFGYNEAEKDEMRAIGGRVAEGEFVWFQLINAVIAISLFALVVMGGMSCLLAAIGGEQNMPNTPASLFFLSLALEVVVSLTIALPVAMVLSAALIGRWYRVPGVELPDATITARYFRKLWFQITRMALIMTAVVMPLWVFVPNDSKFMVIVRLVAPLLSPAVSVLTIGYYFSARLERKAS